MPLTFSAFFKTHSVGIRIAPRELGQLGVEMSSVNDAAWIDGMAEGHADSVA
jgi:hypothetical protein